jgi:ABC-type glycerol-3-phosphate transport system substrate-binding protein
MTRTLRRTALALVATMALTACGGGAGNVDVAADGTFTAPTLEGEPFALADFAGQDIMVWFWAPW